MWPGTFQIKRQTRKSFVESSQRQCLHPGVQ